MDVSKRMIYWPFCLLVSFAFLISCTTHSLPVKERFIGLSPTPIPAVTPDSYEDSEFRKPEEAKFQILGPSPFMMSGIETPLSPIFVSEIFTQYARYPKSNVFSETIRMDQGLSDMIDNKYFFSTTETKVPTFETFARFWMSSSIGQMAYLVGDYQELPRDYVLAKDGLKKFLYYVAASYPGGDLSLWRTTGAHGATENVFTFYQDSDLSYPKNFTLLKKYPDVMADEGLYYIAFLMKDSMGEVQINLFDAQTKTVAEISLTSIARESPRFLQTITNEGKEKLLFAAKDPLTARDGLYMLDPDFPNLLDEIVETRPYEILDLRSQSEVSGGLLKEKVFFSVEDSENKTHLYTSDGNLEVGMTVAKIVLEDGNDNYVPQILSSMRMDDKAILFFSADDGISSRRAYATNGFITYRLDKWEDGENGLDPSDFIVLNMDGEDVAFFLADVSTTYAEVNEEDETIYTKKKERTIWYSFGKEKDATPLWILPQELGSNVRDLSFKKVYEENHLRNKLYYHVVNDDYTIGSRMIDLSLFDEISLIPTAPRFIFKMPPTSFSSGAIIEAINLDFGDTIRLYRDRNCDPFSEFAIGVAQENFLDFYFDDEEVLKMQTSAPYMTPRIFSYYAKKILRGSAKQSHCTPIELVY